MLLRGFPASGPAAIVSGLSARPRARDSITGSSARWRTAAGLGLILLLALVVRVAGFEHVFVGDGEVIATIGDPYYHLRLVEYAATHFPGSLHHDTYLNHPHGAFVPWPPVYDLLVAASGLLLGGGRPALELVAACWPPLLSIVTLLAVYRIGRQTAGEATGLGAALLFALLPAGSLVARIGYADHHAAVMCYGALILMAQADALRPGASAWRVVVCLTLARAALIGSWQGSLAYLGVGEVSFVAVAAYLGRPRGLALGAVSLAGTAALVSLVAGRAASSIGGAFSAIEVSWLHVATCVVLAAWALATRALAVAPQHSRMRRMLTCAGLGAAGLLGLLCIPGVVSGLERASVFLANADFWGAATLETQGLFANIGGGSWAETTLGRLAYALAIAPLFLLLRAGQLRDRASALLVAGWCAGFGVLASLQSRFVSDLAPSAAVAFAVLLAGVAAPIGRRLSGPLRALPALLLGAALIAPAVKLDLGTRLPGTLAALRSDAVDGGDRALQTPAGSLVRFAQQVREVTPDTAGYGDGAASPEYGILSDPSLGHVLHYVARRATPMDNFGPYIGPENVQATLRVLFGADEAEAVRILERLRVRYVVSSWSPVARPGALNDRLHTADGSEGPAGPALGHFRLVAEGPAGGLPLAALMLGPPDPPVTAYKLFERVEGAVLEVPAPQGERVTAHTRIETAERQFYFRTTALPDEDGLARLRVPYASVESGIGPREPYRVLTRKGRARVSVSDDQVRRGATLRIAMDADSPGDSTSRDTGF